MKHFNLHHTATLVLLNPKKLKGNLFTYPLCVDINNMIRCSLCKLNTIILLHIDELKKKILV